MKISCEIIKDLLPLYFDGVCSKESMAMVEEHLAECDNCKAELLSMGEVIPLSKATENLNEAENLKNLSKKWQRGKWKSFLKGAVITIIVVMALAMLLYIFIGIKITIL